MCILLLQEFASGGAKNRGTHWGSTPEMSKVLSCGFINRLTWMQQLTRVAHRPVIWPIVGGPEHEKHES